MNGRIHRSIKEPIRQNLTWHEAWAGPDKGIIFCWERGRREREERPETAAQADRGELVDLDWKGGVDKKLESDTKQGSLLYLATWQGIRGEDLDIDLEGKKTIVCTRFSQAVVFSQQSPGESE